MSRGPDGSPARLALALIAMLALASPGIGAAGPAANAPAPAGATAAATAPTPSVDAGSPAGVLSPASPGAVVPVTITRATTTSIAGFSVTFQLANLTTSGVALGGFLGATGGTPGGPYLTNNGGGSYTVDAATLGAPCGSGATTGTLFNLTLAASVASGTGTVTITQIKLRDCTNGPIPATIGSAATVAIDFAGPAITQCAPAQSGPAACQAALPDFRGGVAASDPHGPVTITQSPAAGTLVGVGATSVTLTATDALGNASSCPTTFTVSDVTPPTVTLTSPNGGESWPAGSSQSVTWTGGDNCGLATFDLELSTDGGATYAPVASAQPYAPSFAWTPPSIPTPHARLRVTVRDGSGNTAADASDADFTIQAPNRAPTLAHIGDRVTDELTPMTFTASASDPDAGQTLTFSLDPGAPAGAAIDPQSGVFTWTPSAAQAPAVDTLTVRVTDNGAPPLGAFETLTITVNLVVLSPVTLAAAPVTSGNDAGGTTNIHLSWTPQASGRPVAIYRHGFGGYPGYDDMGGAVPAAPAAFPPGAGWTLAATASGNAYDDAVPWPGRDDYFYVAYVQGPGTIVSAPSNRTGGTLDYVLGDVTTAGALPADYGHGENAVTMADISLLGSHYGLAGGDVAPYGYLDVGPTTTGYVDGRPLTDQRIDFEDMILFAIDYGTPAALLASRAGEGATRPLSAATLPSDEVWIEGPALVQAGDTFTAHVRMHGNGNVQGLSVTLRWDASIARPTGAAAGAWLAAQNGVMFSPRPGVVDAALLGARATGLTGDGYLADVTFTALAPGSPGLVVGPVVARDELNRSLQLTPLAVASPALPALTALSAPTPNPFRAATELAVDLPEAGAMDLAVYSVDGRRVRTLARGERAAGAYRLTWDGRGESGERMASGVYFARLETRRGQWMRRLALLQ